MVGIGYGYEQQDEYDIAAEVWRQQSEEARERAAWTREVEAKVDLCPRCGEPLTDECDPTFCEACFQDYPMHR